MDYLEKIKAQQINWIGRSEGAHILFPIAGSEEKLKVFTTRPDTIFGATYMVVSPEHPIIDQFKDRIQNMDEVLQYRKEASTKSDFERSELAKDKTGVELKGLHAINPITKKEIPIWISDYVLMGYGTGAIMAVPAHDTRDYEFAKKFDLPIIEVVEGGDISKEAYTECQHGKLINSGFLNGMEVSEAIPAVIQHLEQEKIGERKVNYKLRDWVFSRQRYWGEPIPLVYCEKCGWVPIPEDQLPVRLPMLDNFTPTDDGSSCLKRCKEWLHTTCPKCGGPAEREADTMPNWAGSSWYFLRYTDPHNQEALAGEDALRYWTPIDWYNGGMEHTTLHLLYSRFWHKFLYDLGIVPTKEPYRKRTSHGMVLGANGEKMSKSRGNVVNPDDYISEFGADSFRMYIMFMGAFDQPIPWNEQGTKGCRKFLDRVWRLMDMIQPDGTTKKDLLSKIHASIKKVSEDIERMKFNTAIASLMSLVNDFYANGGMEKGDLVTLLKLLSPFAPHICEEMNELLGNTEQLHHAEWPVWDETLLVADTVEYGVQINGKIKARITLPAGLSQESIQESALNSEEVKTLIADRPIRKTIVVKNIINIVI